MSAASANRDLGIGVELWVYLFSGFVIGVPVSGIIDASVQGGSEDLLASPLLCRAPDEW